MKGQFKISIKAARVNANLSLDDASERLNITTRTLINYENGSTVPNWEMVEKICTCYKVPLDHLRFN